MHLYIIHPKPTNSTELILHFLFARCLTAGAIEL